LAKTVQTVSVPGTTAGVARAADAFDEFCLSANVPNVAKWRFQLALDELLSNIVRHGYAGAAGQIRLTFARAATRSRSRSSIRHASSIRAARRRPT
jgi:anti-sigma regulatory factor (Ser/Thr protein kinase)